MAQNNEAIPISLHNVAFRSTSCYMSQISMLIHDNFISINSEEETSEYI